jgi:uncharacterized damage-inducible protein DinB
MKKHISTLFEYEKWANARILDALAQLKETDEKALGLMAHILLVHMVWYSRIEGKAAPAIWAKKSLNECLETCKVNNIILDGFMAKQTDDTLSKTIKYQNSKGDKFSNSVIQILTHLFNHGTYHRGQIVERLKGKLPQMPVTDFIAYVREK